MKAHVRKSGLIVMTNGMPGSGEVPAMEVLGRPKKKPMCRCGCGAYFESLTGGADLVCLDCQKTHGDAEDRAKDAPDGNLPEGMDRVKEFTKPVTQEVVRREVLGEIERKV